MNCGKSATWPKQRFIGWTSGGPTPEDWDGPRYEPKRSEIEQIRRVCRRVLEHRPGNEYAERKVLESVSGERKKWGSRGQHLDAISYLMRNVCPDFKWDGRKLSRKQRRYLERELAVPLRNLEEQRAYALRNREEAARRIARKTAPVTASRRGQRP